jgi:GNAT superfamily N-acetyltransferase
VDADILGAVITVRPATVTDLFAVSARLVGFYEEFGGVYQYDRQHFLLSWIDWLRQPTHAMFVAYDGDHLLGAIGGEVAAHPYQRSSLMGHEYFWYIIPEARGGGAGKQLLDAFSAWLKERGATHLAMVIMHGKDGVHPGLLQFYKREGFTAFETTVIRGL